MRRPLAQLPIHGATASRRGAGSAALPRGTSLPARDRELERAQRLASTLAERLGERVQLTVTENTSTMLSYRRSSSLLRFRVHRIFLDAPAEVVAALADYAKRRSAEAGKRIERFVREHEGGVIREARIERQRATLSPVGRVHDLQAIFDSLNETYFGGRIEARIGWGRSAPRRRRGSIKLGSYLHESKVIRVHPALDRGDVPRFFVRYVIFHEMLHQASPPRQIGGRRVAHTPEFRALERAYPDYERAIAWEKENLELLLDPRRLRFDPDDPLA